MRSIFDEVVYGYWKFIPTGATAYCPKCKKKTSFTPVNIESYPHIFKCDNCGALVEISYIHRSPLELNEEIPDILPKPSRVTVDSQLGFITKKEMIKEDEKDESRR